MGKKIKEYTQIVWEKYKEFGLLGIIVSLFPDIVPRIWKFILGLIEDRVMGAINEMIDKVVSRIDISSFSFFPSNSLEIIFNILRWTGLTIIISVLVLAYLDTRRVKSDGNTSKKKGKNISSGKSKSVEKRQESITQRTTRTGGKVVKHYFFDGTPEDFRKIVESVMSTHRIQKNFVPNWRSTERVGLNITLESYSEYMTLFRVRIVDSQSDDVFERRKAHIRADTREGKTRVLFVDGYDLKSEHITPLIGESFLELSDLIIKKMDDWELDNQ